MKYDAFISYRRDNGFYLARLVRNQLEKRGVTSFLDLEELRSGEFNKKLYDAIKNIRIFILILPKAALVDILLYVIENKINMRVIVNDEETVGQLSVHMRQPLKKYYGYGKSLQDWIEKARDYPDIISVKVADVPLMHRYYCMKGKKEGIAKVSFYTYGNYASEKNFQFTFSNLDDEYQLYEEDFEYLWNKASHEVFSGR